MWRQPDLRALGPHSCALLLQVSGDQRVGDLVGQLVLGALGPHGHCPLAHSPSSPHSTSETSLYQVLLGALQLVQPGPHAVLRGVRRVHSHPQYRGLASSADVALVELDKPVAFNRYMLPVCLPQPMVLFRTNMSCWVTGWGSPSETGTGKGNLWEGGLNDPGSLPRAQHLGSMGPSLPPLIECGEKWAGVRGSSPAAPRPQSRIISHRPVAQPADPAEAGGAHHRHTPLQPDV